jgi:hypothetical protein
MDMTAAQQANWPLTAPLTPEATAARDEARRLFAGRARGFSRTHGASDVLLLSAIAALRSEKPEDFGDAVNRVRRQLDEIEAIWATAIGSSTKVLA